MPEVPYVWTLTRLRQIRWFEFTYRALRNPRTSCLPRQGRTLTQLPSFRKTMTDQTTFPVKPDSIYFNGKISTQDTERSFVDSIAIAGGRIVATGSREVIMRLATDATRCIDLQGRTVIPGLNDSHLHIIRGGL